MNTLWVACSIESRPISSIYNLLSVTTYLMLFFFIWTLLFLLCHHSLLQKLQKVKKKSAAHTNRRGPIFQHTSRFSLYIAWPVPEWLAFPSLCSLHCLLNHFLQWLSVFSRSKHTVSLNPAVSLSSQSTRSISPMLTLQLNLSILHLTFIFLMYPSWGSVIRNNLPSGSHTTAPF